MLDQCSTFIQSGASLSLKNLNSQKKEGKMVDKTLSGILIFFETPKAEVKKR
jgi:hypothetical protein